MTSYINLNNNIELVKERYDIYTECVNILRVNSNQPSSIPKHIRDIVINSTPPCFHDYPFKVILYSYVNFLKDFPTCSVCDTKVKKLKDLDSGFRKFCSHECSSRYFVGKRGANRAKKALTSKTHKIDSDEGYEADFLKSLLRDDGKLNGNKTTRILKDGVFEKWFFSEYPSLAVLDNINAALRYWADGKYEVNHCPSCSKIISSPRRTFCSVNCSNSDKNKIANTKNTNNEKYGYDFIFQTEEIKNRNRDRHAIRSKIHRTEKWHRDILDNVAFKKICEEMSLREISDYYNIPYQTVSNYVREVGYTTKKSQNGFEKDVLEHIRQFYDGCIIERDRNIINPYEMDLVIPEFNIAIECNGIFYHSANFNCDYNKNRHRDKSKMAEEAGYQMIHLWEHDWKDSNKRRVLCSIIKNSLQKSLKIYARKCTIIEPSYEIASKFFDNNHLCGRLKRSTKFIGLVCDDELVAVASFGKPRYNNSYDWELHRYCTLLGNSVVGGFSKILSNITGSIISYVSLDRGQGNSYKHAGFKCVNYTPPTPTYYKYMSGEGYMFYTRQQVQKHKLSNILEEFDDSVSANDNLFANGFRVFYNCGNAVYVRK